MASSIALVLPLLCMTVEAATLPSPCKFPLQWEADVKYSYLGLRSTASYHIFYDAINTRERTVGQWDYDNIRYPEHDSLDTLTLWKEMKQYTVNTKTGDCLVSNITGNFSRRGVDDSAHYLLTERIGGIGVLGEYIQMMTYMSDSSDEYTAKVTFPTCIPISEQRYHGEYGYEYTKYYNVTVGMNTKAWTAPKHCMPIG